MTIEGGLLAILKNDSPLIALVSTRVYAVNLPQDTTLPAITYQRISTTFEHLMGGRGQPVHARFQVSSWGTTYDSARDVADAVLAALDRYGGTSDSTVIEQIFAADDGDRYEAQSAEGGIYHVAQDFLVHYET